MFWRELYSDGGVNNKNNTIKYNFQRLLLTFIEFVTFLGPGALWFYYDFDANSCNSPVDEDMSLMVIFYFVISIMICVLALNTCLPRCYELTAFLLFVYWLAKITLAIIMLVNIQNDYYESWEYNTCSNLKLFTLLWLIWNYIVVCVSVICLFIYIIFPCCCY